MSEREMEPTDESDLIALRKARDERRRRNWTYGLVVAALLGVLAFAVGKTIKDNADERYYCGVTGNIGDDCDD